ncbi:MAG TPA: hypothetical protein VFA04_11415 [Bryobacteraceae bacterium]|nr:hypothetical protein [Bryobacteraceae bacterium]
MPSSISSSELLTDEPAVANRRYARGVIAWLVLLTLLLASLETGTRIAFRHASHIESRIASEYVEAVSIRPGSGGRPTILLLGNSLLHEGVDIERMQQLMAPRARVVRFVIESTDYLDWLYGIQGLLARGSRPDVIVLCLNTQQLRSNDIRGDYSSYYLFAPRDIPAVAREVHYDLTQTSSLYFAHYSLFYAARNNIRNFVLGHVDPPYGNLLFELQPVPSVLPPAGQIEQMAEVRLRRLRLAADAYGARFVFLFPPGFMAGENEIVTAGAKTGTTVMAPIHTGALPEGDFRDGFHLNAHGRSIFTDALGAALQRYLGTQTRSDGTRQR